MTRASPRPQIELLTVARWFPSALDPAHGRFVADQAAAAAATGHARVTVASFEPVHLVGGGAIRRRQHDLVKRQTASAIRDHPGTIAERGRNVDRHLRVARLPYPLQPARGRSPGQQGDAQAAALEALVPARWPGPNPTRALIHAHTGYPDGFAAAVVAGCLGLPLVLTEHSSFLETQLADAAQRVRFEQALARAARIIAVSNSFAAELRGRAPDQAHKVIVIPNAVRLDQFQLRPDLPRTAGALLYVGHLYETKGLETLLQAFAQAHRAQPHLTLRLIGGSHDRADRPRWEQLSTQLGVASAVSFSGPLDRVQVAEAMARADLLVHASPRETFGMVAAEALASGLPVVAVASDGLRETMADQVDELGALVPAHDPDALARAILETLERRDHFDPHRLREAVERRYSQRAVGERLIELYESVLDGEAPRTGQEARVATTTASVGTDVDGVGATVQDEDAATGPDVVTAQDTRAALEVIRDGAATTLPGPPRTIVVALHRERMSPLLQLPPSIRARLSVIVTRPPRGMTIPPDFEHVAQLNLDQSWWQVAGRGTPDRFKSRRAHLRWATRHPLRAIRRLRHRHRRDLLAAQEAQRLVPPIIEAALEELGPTGTIDLVCVTGLDYLAVARLMGADRIRLAPGGIAWAADHLSSADPYP